MNTLSISGDRVVAHTVANILAWHGVGAEVTARLSVTGGNVEPAVLIEFHEDPDAERGRLNAIWKDLQGSLGLGCAWLVRGDFSGCILDYLREAS